jgi:radical SAM protein with 4Fe4S-binding SPASM domain
MRLTEKQHKEFYPLLLKLYKKYSVPAKLDCSFIPLVCYHKPDRKRMEQFAVYGCEAGNVLVGIRSNGKYAGCSFLENDGDVYSLLDQWGTSGHLTECRSWGVPQKEPCASCDYADICKGGCHAVAAFVTGDISDPDPECPIVSEYSL